MRDTVDGINEAAWDRAMAKGGSMRDSRINRDRRAASFDRATNRVPKVETRYKITLADQVRDIKYSLLVWATDERTAIQIAEANSLMIDKVVAVEPTEDQRVVN